MSSMMLQQHEVNDRCVLQLAFCCIIIVVFVTPWLYKGWTSLPIAKLIITITILSNLIAALTASFFTNYWVGFKSDSEIIQLAVIIVYLKSDGYARG